MADPCAACAEAWRQGFACDPVMRTQGVWLVLGAVAVLLAAAGLVAWMMVRGWRGWGTR